MMFGLEDIGVMGLRALSHMLMQRRPRAKIAPCKVTGQAIELTLRFTLRRAWLQHRVIIRDRLAARIQFSKNLLKLWRPPRVSDLLKHFRSLRLMFAHRIRQRLRSPQE